MNFAFFKFKPLKTRFWESLRIFKLYRDYYPLIFLFLSIPIYNCSCVDDNYNDQENEKQFLTEKLNSVDYSNLYGDPKEALNWSGDLISIAVNLKDSASLCKIFLIRSGCFNELEIFDSSFIAAQKALLIANNIKNDTLSAKANNLLGNFYSSLNDYIKSASYYTEAMTLMEKAGNVTGKATSLNNLGIIYREIGEYERSIDCYNKVMKVFDSVNDEYKSALVSLNLVAVLTAVNDNINARKHIKKSFEILTRYEDTLQLARLFGNQSLFYINIGEIDSAIITLNQVAELSREIKNQRLYCIMLYNMGVLYYTHYQDIAKAKTLIEEVLRINEEIRDLEIEMESNHILSEIEQSTGNHEKSNDLFRKYVVLRDSIKGGNVKKEIVAMELQNDIQRKEHETELLAQRLMLKGKQNTILITSLGSSILLICLIVLLIYYAYGSIKKANAIKKLEKQRLEEQMEKERKIREIEKLRLDNEIESAKKELVCYSLQIVSKNDLIDKIAIVSRKYYNENSLSRQYFNDLSRIISENSNTDLEWEYFKSLFQKIHQRFFQHLKYLHPSLTEHELRFCAYIKINLRPKEIARILNISPNTVKSFRYRLKKKLGLGENYTIEDHLRDM